MFERFSERARQVIVLAQEEARGLKHNYIGTEHLLLGLLREEEGLAARVLESLDIELRRVRAQVVRIVGSAEEVTSGQIPFTPRAKKVLELALQEALQLRHNYIGTEHILLGLVRENEGVAARILLDFDADAYRIRTDTLGLIDAPGSRRRRRASSPAPAPETRVLQAQLPLTPAARKALSTASFVALAAQSQAVEPDHLLGGLLATEDPDVTAVADAVGLDRDAVQAPGPAAAQLEPSALTRRAFDLALAHALVTGSSQVSAFSLLAGVAQLQNRALVELMRDLGTDVDRLRHEIAERSQRPPDPPPA